jgi:glyoxylase-like metal-dependent hydrolase (beta-lactamase superfamily II)
VIEIETIEGGIQRFRLARTLLGRGLYFTTAYLVDGLLVDSGCAHSVKELVAALEGLPRIHTIVNTHSHEDHIAGNAAVFRRHGARVLAHPLALPVLAEPRRLQPEPLYRRIFWGYPEPSLGSAIGETVETERYRFDVIHTPGHSPDHICLFEPDQGWLFVGDAFVGGRDRAIRWESNVWQIVASLRTLESLGAKLMFPGSGTIYSDPRQAIKQKIDYLERTGEKVRQLYDQGLSTARIREQLFGPEPLIARITFGDFTGLNLVRTFIKDRPAGNGTASRDKISTCTTTTGGGA